MISSFLSRSRWAAVGAAVAVTLGGGGVLYSFAASGAPSSFTAVTPVRILDTRSGVGAPAAPLGANKVLTVPIAGANGVPANASAVVLNVTVVDGSTQSYLTVYPQGGTRPGVSSLNWADAGAHPNSVTVSVGTGGDVDFYNAVGTVQVIADLDGYYMPGAPSATSSPWEYASSATTQTIDGTLLQTETISAPSITATALADSSINVYTTYGVNVIPLPYTSYAGGIVNTLSYQLAPGQIIITRFTNDDSASVGYGALQFRYVITTATGPSVGVAGPLQRAGAGSASSSAAKP